MKTQNKQPDQPKKKPKVLYRIFRSGVLLYLGVMMFAWGCTDRMIFVPPRSGYVDGDDVIKLETADGKKISAMHFKNPSAKYTIVVNHGNAEDIGYGRETNMAFAAKGYNVFAYDYHGYGTSQGRPTEQNTYLDIEAAYQYLTDTCKIPPGDLIILGRSVGSGPAVYIASREKVGAILLESPFVSAFRVVTKIPLLPFDKFNNLSRIQDVKCPILIIHGTDDHVVANWHGRKLYDKANEPKICWWVEGADHNNLYSYCGENYWRKLTELTDLVEKGIINPDEKSDQ